MNNNNIHTSSALLNIKEILRAPFGRSPDFSNLPSQATANWYSPERSVGESLNIPINSKKKTKKILNIKEDFPQYSNELHSPEYKINPECSALLISQLQEEENTMVLQPTLLSIKNAHPRDVHIQFEDKNHEYTVLNEKGYTSVTTFIHKHFEPFDADGIINNILNSKKMNDPQYKYYGKTRQDILDDWERNRNEAAQQGTRMHYDIECYFNGINNENSSVEFQYFLEFVKDFPELIPYRTEWMVYYEEYRISGSIDMVFKNPDGTYSIYDWKRTKGLEYESMNEKMARTHCINHIPDTNFWHYCLQLNMYKFILEQKYDKKITGLYLVCLHPLNSPKNYERVEVPFIEDDIVCLLDWWKKEATSRAAV